MYYLQSRYYNPEWGRFINADSNLGQPGQLLSHNLFTYCYNNPVNMIDADGNAPAWVKWAIGSAVIAGLVVATIATGGAAGVACAVILSSTLAGAAAGTIDGAMSGDAADGFLNGTTFGFGNGVLGVGLEKAAAALAAKLLSKALSALSKPPGWNASWKWLYPEGTSTKGAEPRWFDELGGEWRWHAPDKWHTEGHWDYNPWKTWNDKWYNVDVNGNIMPK